MRQDDQRYLICVKTIGRRRAWLFVLANMVREAQMLSFSHRIRFWTAIVVAAIMLGGTLSLAYAATGAVRFHIVKAGFIVGIGGGSGTLNFKGRNYRLSIGGKIGRAHV